jgi:hypothetical protein
MPTLPTPKQAATGGMLLALGVAIGAAVGGTHDEPKPDNAGIAASVDASKPIDPAAYHRAISAARAGRDVVDVMTPFEVKPGDIASAEVNMPIGTRANSAELVGTAAGHFAIDCAGCGFSFEDGADATTIRLHAKNTSSEAVRLVALIHYTKGPSQ